MPTFDALESADVRYVVVGGVAAILHGVPRFTAAIDLVIAFDPANVERLADAVKKLGMKPRVPVDVRDLADEKKRAEWSNEKNMKAFSFVNPSNPILSLDLLIDSTIPFEMLFDESLLMPVNGRKIRVCSRRHLIQLKRDSARPLDMQDIRTLGEVND